MSVPWVVGIDEAGYGPSLGPLVQAAIALRLPDGDPAGWGTLKGTVRRCSEKADGRLLIDDSKKVYTKGGLEALEREATASYSTRFAALDGASQDALLARVEQRAVQTAWPLDPASFFRMAIEHAMEGYYGDPGNGGNLNRIAWHMIGFEVTA